jgi:hypothetical protein
MASLVRDQIPWFIAGASIIIMFGDYILDPMAGVSTAVRNWTVIVAAFAMGLALVTMTIYHLGNLTRRGDGWYYSICTLAGCYIMLIVGLMPPIQGSPQFTWLYKWVNTVSGRTTYAALAFWISAAAYRTLRVRTIESTLMVVAAMIAMFANAPVSALVGPFKPWALWLLKVPSTGAYRAIAITSACGMLALGLRTLLGRVRPWE